MLHSIFFSNQRKEYFQPEKSFYIPQHHIDTLSEKTSSTVTALTHEIRNPLANIYLALELLMPMVKDEEQEKYFNIIMRSSIRINDIVNDLLKSTPPIEIQLKEYSIHHLLDEVLSITDDRIMLKNIRVKKNYGAQNDKIISDWPKMKIAFTNIIINAIEAMHYGTGELNLVTKTINGITIVSIEDNGIGMNRENLKKIFKPYISIKPNGLGLGLSTTQQIFFLNHVGIKVESEPGIGTKFILLFDKYEYPKYKM